MDGFPHVPGRLPARALWRPFAMPRTPVTRWTPVGTEGTQMPSAFGGLRSVEASPTALDWVEAARHRECAGDFRTCSCRQSPCLPRSSSRTLLTQNWRLWHLLLEGDRVGALFGGSEDCIDWKSPDYALTPKAKAPAPALREMVFAAGPAFSVASGCACAIPVFIHYSQAEHPGRLAAWIDRGRF